MHSGVLRAAEGQAVEEARDEARRAAVVDGRADDEAIGSGEFVGRLIDDVRKDTAAGLHTAVAGNAVLHRFLAEPDHLRLDALLVECGGNLCQCGVGAALLIGTAVDQKDFAHSDYLCE